MQRYVIHTEGTSLSDSKAFYEIVLHNPDYQWERDSNGNIILMTPTYSLSGKYNSKLSQLLANWNDQYQLGEVFDSSTGFTLPDTSIVSPDVSWIRRDRWYQLNKKERSEMFAPIAPDFVIELKSKNNLLHELQKKMEQYVRNGVKLGWLIDIDDEKVYVYEQPNTSPSRIIKNFQQCINGDPILKGFTLNLNELKKIKEEENK